MLRDMHTYSKTTKSPERRTSILTRYAESAVRQNLHANTPKPSGANWIAELPQLNDTVVEYNDEFGRARLRALQSVDEMVEGVVQRLTDSGILDNTYIFYTSDNGFHISQHRMHPGKTCGYETDINIPLIVRGPGVGAGKVLDAVTSHTDLAPTLLKIAGGDLREDFDGLPIPFNEEDKRKTEHVNVEYWGRGIPEGKYGSEGGGMTIYVNNTYKALRLIGDTYNLYYSVWCTNETELYDMTVNAHHHLPL